MLVYMRNHWDYPTLANPKPCEILAIQHSVYGTRYKVSWGMGRGVSGYLPARDFRVQEVPV